MRVMMDAIKFLQEYKRMCGQYANTCSECPISEERKKHGVELCDDVFINLHPYDVVAVVEKWSLEHPE